MVAVAVFLAGLARLLLYVFLTVNALRVHGNERGEAVAAVNVEALCHRAEAVRGVNVATVLHVVLHAPAEFVGVVGGVAPIVAPEVVEVVDIGAFCADHFAEHTGLRHFEGVEFVVVVAAVFENHAVLAGLFREVNQIPALFEVHGRGHFDGRVLAVFEGALGNGEVVVPVGSHVDEVDVGALAKFLVAILAEVDVGRRQAGLLQIALAGFCAAFLIVAKRNDLHAGNVAETVHCTRTAHAETYEGHAHRLDFRGSEAEHMLLTCRAFGSFCHDGTFVPMPLRRGRERLCLHRDACAEHQHGEQR